MAPNVSIFGDPGVYLLQYSSTLNNQSNWLTLTSVVLTGSATNWLDYSGIGQEQRFYRAVAVTNPDPAVMVWIAPGHFVMGSPPDEAMRQAWGQDETQHTVTLTKGFYMSKYLVTQGDFSSVMGYNPSYFVPSNGFVSSMNSPVESVSWNDATNYCAQLTQLKRLAGRLPAGWVYRLPTAAEWEYTCRAGTTTAFYFGDTILDGMVNFESNNGYNSVMGSILNTNALHNWQRTSPVGNYAANPWGLYDMVGNVWEWCLDWAGEYPTGAVTDPTGPTTGTQRVFRGGSLAYEGGFCRAANYISEPPSFTWADVGFRVVVAPLE